MDEEIKNIEDVRVYEEKVYANRFSKYFLMRKLYPDLNADSNVLDYGCGVGLVAHDIFKTFNCNVDAVEIDKNELQAGMRAYVNSNIRFEELTNFGFPEKKYDLVISSAVIEHVHNTGTYLSQINRMIKDEGFLLIGLPNVSNLRFLIHQLFMNEKRAKKLSKKMIGSYNKTVHHIHAWDIHHFTILMASCGFVLERYVPTGGIVLPFYLQRIPVLGKFIPTAILINLPLFRHWSYGMYYLFKKQKSVEIDALS